MSGNARGLALASVFLVVVARSNVTSAQCEPPATCPVAPPAPVAPADAPEPIDPSEATVAVDSDAPECAAEGPCPLRDAEGRQRATAIAMASFTSTPGVFVRGIEPGFFVEGGLARHDRRPLGTARALLGVTAALDPHFFTLGAVGDYSSIDGFAVGGGLDYLASAPGMFMTAAVLVDPGDAAVVSGTFGWQVFAVDFQQRIGADHPGRIVFFKLRAPISWIVRTLVYD